ncbi:hypothetical protein EJ04DRAFT_594315 [Polyplosphaeria fusca]|uniref:Uncharacterized protein n=1 Tax=Polyplosphaeria fusca TaxID=682080 RepID=A0A9P4QJH4_9PLEO|nr:hypothetical protein EJ04DRAFT_594315 [Polyplosphaeria fusca]
MLPNCERASPPQCSPRGYSHNTSRPIPRPLKRIWPPVKSRDGSSSNQRERSIPRSLTEDRRRPYENESWHDANIRAPRSTPTANSNPSKQNRHKYTRSQPSNGSLTLHVMGLSHFESTPDGECNDIMPDAGEGDAENISCYPRSSISEPKAPSLTPSPVAPQFLSTDSAPYEGPMPTNMSAFAYAVYPYLHEARIDISKVALPTTTKHFTPSQGVSASPPQLMPSPQTIDTDILYFPPPPRPLLPELARGEQNLGFRLRYLTLYAALMRCSVISRIVPVKSYLRTNRAPAPGPNYSVIEHIAERTALPLAKRIGHSKLEAQCYYWIGRGRIGMQSWIPAKEALERALEIVGNAKTDKLAQTLQKKDVEFWLNGNKQELELQAIQDGASFQKKEGTKINRPRQQELSEEWYTDSLPHLSKNWTKKEREYITQDVGILGPDGRVFFTSDLDSPKPGEDIWFQYNPSPAAYDSENEIGSKGSECSRKLENPPSISSSDRLSVFGESYETSVRLGLRARRHVRLGPVNTKDSIKFWVGDVEAVREGPDTGGELVEVLSDLCQRRPLWKC